MLECDEQMKTKLNAWNFHLLLHVDLDLRNFYITFVSSLVTVVWLFVLLLHSDILQQLGSVFKLTIALNIAARLLSSDELNKTTELSYSIWHCAWEKKVELSQINRKLFQIETFPSSSLVNFITLDHRHHHRHCSIVFLSSYISQSSRFTVNIYDFKRYRMYGTSTSISFSSQQ